MMWTERIVLLVLGLTLLAVTVILIRKRRLREEYAVLWVITSLVMLGLVVVPQALDIAAEWMHMTPHVLLVLVVLALVGVVALYSSVMMSKRLDREKAVSDEVAGLREEVDRLRDQVNQPPPPPVEPKPKPPSLRT
jgi:uncharacterized membrane protein